MFLGNTACHVRFNAVGLGLKCRFSTSGLRLQNMQLNYYEVLELPHSASIREIKTQFKKLSKKYHPDLNTHLTDDEKKANSDRFVTIVNAYDTLKDMKKKKNYDLSLKSSGQLHNRNNSGVRRNQEWHNKYYGEAKYYSKSNAYSRSSYSASGLNTKRHRVRYDTDFENNSSFSGEHRNYGDKHGVPHFNYNEHLLKHLKFEQRIINRQLTDDDREAIMRQLSKSGDLKNMSEELITKHLMRQVHHTKNRSNSAGLGHWGNSSSSANGQNKNPYMYHGPQDDSDGLKVAFLCVGAGGSLYLLYQAFFS
mmetsp:Transcript_2385/g.2643  ORF Transcript_2385/g.2643 Transcript_2385/m.2643 type:complete len:308 (-) Transcript_2385:105-1028(-)